VDESLDARVAAVAALDEPTRRRLYDHVVGRPDAVSRDEAAAALSLPRNTAAFHLDRLVEQGLLDVVYARRSGRSGPGAGRPAKLYRRSEHQVTVSIPDRRYDVAGWLLAGALDEAEQSGGSPRTALGRRSHQLGAELGEAARRHGGAADLLDVLRDRGFEPQRDGVDMVLGNCPFQALAQDYPETVCGMNLQLLDGLLRGLRDTGWRARLDPAPDRCCVRLQPGDDR
jgi:predicted ArsR family transcriptional regulator